MTRSQESTASRALFLGFLLFLLMACGPTPGSDTAGAATQSLSINGLVEQSRSITAADLQKMEQHDLGTIQLSKGNGEVYLELEAATGVLLTELLQSVTIKGQTNKNYSSYYVVCTATDGYKTLYSWNELFNSPIGDGVYLIMQANKQSLIEMDQSIMMISLEDQISGKRNLRQLDNIEILAAG
ncbi:MAG: hypothetical protein KTR30_05270 [Saprospiraceae bacterium]|nr:hypothetical protein [Saprospiraceae bacterium]